MLAKKTRGCSRVVVYVKEGINVRQLRKYETDDLSTIWLEAGLPREKKLVLGCSYREHDYIKLERGEPKQSGHPEQLQRWEKFVDIWSKVIDEQKEVCVVGDLNWDLLEENIQSSLHEKINNIYNDKILPRGVVQMVKGPTRFHSACRPSKIDHVHTTNPERLIW